MWNVWDTLQHKMFVLWIHNKSVLWILSWFSFYSIDFQSRSDKIFYLQESKEVWFEGHFVEMSSINLVSSLWSCAHLSLPCRQYAGMTLATVGKLTLFTEQANSVLISMVYNGLCATNGFLFDLRVFNVLLDTCTRAQYDPLW